MSVQFRCSGDVLRREAVILPYNAQTEEPPLVACSWLTVQYICSSPQSTVDWRLGDKGPDFHGLNTTKYHLAMNLFYINNYVMSGLGKLKTFSVIPMQTYFPTRPNIKCPTCLFLFFSGMFRWDILIIILCVCACVRSPARPYKHVNDIPWLICNPPATQTTTLPKKLQIHK